MPIDYSKFENIEDDLDGGRFYGVGWVTEPLVDSASSDECQLCLKIPQASTVPP